MPILSESVLRSGAGAFAGTQKDVNPSAIMEYHRWDAFSSVKQTEYRKEF